VTPAFPAGRRTRVGDEGGTRGAGGLAAGPRSCRCLLPPVSRWPSDGAGGCHSSLRHPRLRRARWVRPVDDSPGAQATACIASVLKERRGVIGPKRPRRGALPSGVVGLPGYGGAGSRFSSAGVGCVSRYCPSGRAAVFSQSDSRRISRTVVPATVASPRPTASRAENWTRVARPAVAVGFFGRQGQVGRRCLAGRLPRRSGKIPSFVSPRTALLGGGGEPPSRRTQVLGWTKRQAWTPRDRRWFAVDTGRGALFRAQSARRGRREG